MSLEQAIEANTAAINELILALHGAASTPVALSSVHAASAIPSHELEKSTAKAVKEKAPVEVNVADPVETLLTYEELRQRFLMLVKFNKPAALKLLAEMGVDTLKEIQGKETLYAAVLSKIEEAEKNG